MRERTFVCEDCKAGVFETGEVRTAMLCHGCEIIRGMKERGVVSAKVERDLREILSCQLPVEETDG